MRKLFMALSVVSLLSACGATVPSPAPANQVGFHLLPKTASAKVGDTVTLTAHLDTAGNTSDAVDLIVKYDPSLLMVVDHDASAEGTQVEAGTLFEAYPVNMVDEGAGEVNLSAGSMTK